MTAIKNILLRCDVPDCNRALVIENGSVYEARKAARAFGWTFRAELDNCPMHDLLKPMNGESK